MSNIWITIQYNLSYTKLAIDNSFMAIFILKLYFT